MSGASTEIDHTCPRCGKFGAWGFGVNLRRGSGRFYCYDHRPDESAPLPPVTPPKQGALL